MQRFFVAYRKPISVLLAIAVMSGMFVYTRMQTSLFPDITFPKIKIIADAGQQPVDKMMITVTQPLENAIKQVPDLKDIRSTTSRGSCEISAYIDWKADVDISQQRIESKISEVRNALPPDVDITVAKMNPSILPVIGYSLESNAMSPMDLHYLAVHTIKPFLSQVEGVSEVRVIGGKSKEYWLVLNPTKMTTLGLTPESITNALAQTNFIKSNGYLTEYRQMYLTITDEALANKESIETLAIANVGGRVIHVNDIADVQIREAKEYIKINANGREGLLIAVVKQPNANLIDVSKRMNDKLAALKNILPNNVHIKPYYVQADFVNDAIGSVRDSLWIGLILAIVIAVLFLRSLKASAVILITIPITLCLTLVVLYVMGQTFNIMTLGAIAAAIGLIIDDAIVVVEQIHRAHEENPEESSSSLVQHAIKFLFPAMLASSLSTIVIFLPFVLMSDVAGAYFKVLTDSMIVTLVCSFIVTWLGLSVIYLLLSRKNEGNKKNN